MVSHNRSLLLQANTVIIMVGTVPFFYDVIFCFYMSISGFTTALRCYAGVE